MNATARLLNASEAAQRVGVSTKALRIYEERGLLKPMRTEASWRAYGTDEINRAIMIAELRALGLSLNEVSHVLKGDRTVLERALAAREAALHAHIGQHQETIRRIQKTRSELAECSQTTASVLTFVNRNGPALEVTIDLPWPWNGECFELRSLRKLTYIVGPLGSGKTRLAMKLASTIEGASFIRTEPREEDASTAGNLTATDPRLQAKASLAMAEIEQAGGTASDALFKLLSILENEGPTVLVIDMLEEGLDTATQEALIAWLRRRSAVSRPVMFLTRSSAILDLDAVGADEAIIFCPANHSPPILVAPYPGAPGYEALTSCLATPDVRARTDGVIAIRKKR